MFLLLATADCVNLKYPHGRFAEIEGVCVCVCVGVLCVCLCVCVIQSVPPQTLSMSSPLISFKTRHCLCGSYGCIVNRGSHSCGICKCLLLRVGFSKTE